MTCYLSFEEISLGYSYHAHKRANQRGVTADTVAHILRFGRKQHQKGAVYYSIGRKEVSKYKHLCPALKNMNGLHVVMSLSGEILTIFRNKNFKIVRHC